MNPIVISTLFHIGGLIAVVWTDIDAILFIYESAPYLRKLHAFDILAAVLCCTS